MEPEVGVDGTRIDYTRHVGLRRLLQGYSLAPVSVWWITRVCWDSPVLFGQLAAGFRDASVEPADRARVAEAASGAGNVLAAEVPGQAVTPGVHRRTFAEQFERGQVSMLGIELIAAGKKDCTAERVASAIEAAFREDSWIAALNQSSAPGESRWFTFEERCQASGVSFLIPAVPLDEGARGSGVRRWNDPPRARIQLAGGMVRAGPADGTDRAALRHPKLLMIEAGVRLQLQPISRSWRNCASDLRSRELFCSFSLRIALICW